jgi:hypothetical protein
MDFLPSINDNRKSTIKIKNNTFAIPAALAAIPVNPNIPATMATIRKIIVQRNIVYIFRMNNTGIISETMPKKNTHNIQLLLKVYNHHFKANIFLIRAAVFYSIFVASHSCTEAP